VSRLNPVTFYQELRRRRVFRVAVVYGVGAWGVIAACDVIFPQLTDWVADPDRAMRAVFIAAITLFPIALVFGWLYDVTADGIQRTANFSETAHDPDTSLHSVDRGIISALGAMVLAVLAATAVHIVRMAPTVSVAASPERAPAPENSIAVLPFVNRSNLEEDAFFVDGIHDDILTQLSKIGSLTVIARTSVERFRGTTLPVKEVAGQLGVRVILEGAVQRAGDRVHVNVQLIDADTERHLWADTYDRELTIANIFAIQTEVATAIAGALQAKLTASEESRFATIPTQSLEAWERYQRGRQRLTQATAVSLQGAVDLFQDAITIDPRFALAYAALSETLFLRQNSYGSKESSIAQAKLAVAQALELDPNLPEGAMMHAVLHSSCDQPGQMDLNFQRALKLDPNSASSHFWYAWQAQTCGRMTLALTHYERAAQLDPLSVLIQMSLSEVLARVGRIDAALEHAQRAIEIDPSHRYGYQAAGIEVAYLLGEVGWGLSYFQRAAEIDPQRPGTHITLGWMYMDLGDFESAERHLNIASDLSLNNAFRKARSLAMMALVRLHQGDRTEAIRLLDHAMAIDPEPSHAIRAVLDAEAGDLDAARRRVLEQRPALLAPGARMDTGAARDCCFGRDISYALLLAAILQRSGETEQAMRLLDQWERVLPEMSRVGHEGYYLADVEIFAMRGQTKEALAALRQAVDEGWRGPWWRFQMDWLETFENLRGHPELEAIRAEIEADMARQRAELEARTGELPLDLSQFMKHRDNRPSPDQEAANR